MAASLTLLPALLSLFGLKVLPRKQRRAVRAGQFIERHAHRLLGPLVGVRRPPPRPRRDRFAAPSCGARDPVLLDATRQQRPGQRPEGLDDPHRLRPDRYGVRRRLQLHARGGRRTGPAQPTGVPAEGVATRLRPRPASTRPAVPCDPAQQRPSPSCRSSRRRRRRMRRRPTSWSRHLRSRTLPPLYDGTANHIYVYGDTAINVDFAKVLSRKMPLFIAVVVGLSFLLLLIAFRSLVIPLTAAVMNLLAAGGVVRSRRGDLPVRLGLGSLGARQGRPDRCLGTGDVLRDPVRTVDGLPGVPRQPHARGMGAHQGQPARRSSSARPRPAASSRLRH